MTLSCPWVPSGRPSPNKPARFPECMGVRAGWRGAERAPVVQAGGTAQRREHSSRGLRSPGLSFCGSEVREVGTSWKSAETCFLMRQTRASGSFVCP